jgi:hypothetical protein
MEIEGALPCSQQSVTKSYPEPDESNSYPHTRFVYCPASYLETRRLKGIQNYD